MHTIVLNYVQHIFPGEAKNFPVWKIPPCALLSYGPVCIQNYCVRTDVFVAN